MRKRHWIRQRGSAALLLLAAAIALSSRAGAQGTSPAPPAHNTLTVGALLSLTGTWRTLGVDSQAALEIATQDINAQLTRQGVDARVQVVVSDTQLNPDTALQKLQASVSATERHMLFQTSTIYDSVPGCGGASGSANLTVTAPTTPGLYYLGFARAQGGCCLCLTSGWWSGAPDQSRNFAALCVF